MTQIMPNPQKYIKIATRFIDDKSIIEVKVSKGNALYYIKKFGRSASGCYVRLGTTCRSMSEEEIEQRYLESISPSENAIKDIPILRDDLTFAKLKQYLISNGIHINEETFCKNFGLVTMDGRYNMLADILADENMNSVKIAVFKGKDKSDFVKRNEYGYTCLIESLEKVINYCDALNETFIDVSVRPRREERLFSNEAFKEAWINACVHNKWSEELAPSIYWYQDRLEIVSYGGIPKNLTKEEFLSGKTEPVNKELMKIFLQCGIVEHSGHGVPLVVKEYGEEAYAFSQNMITVTIPFNRLQERKNEPVNVPVSEPVKLTKSAKLVLQYIKEFPNGTISDIMASLNVSRETVKRALKALRENGYIVRVGSDKSGSWKIIE